ncbi:paeninodin family lasso peptide [Paenibacillus aurantius]|uniref:Paeninodin family lasso peptide n=1 Tax=Paenibacillus aurantius TaxID=2918900 RepID=A0AA96RFN1_9BACL|nr:paeninodin family lasso peptide [Paenibacillus aurantius]WNQ12192.1 paeninodin family lasso peptide [Paenibacillus aurantius]
METRDTGRNEQGRRVWQKPELEVLNVKYTAYWSFEIGPDGFPINVWVDES